VVGLRKVFGEHAAVKRADLTVMPGSFYGLVGPNGAGKTTTLSMAVGLLRPDAGRSLVFGTDVWQEPLHAKTLMGVLPDGLAMPEQLTGRELLGDLGRLRGLDHATTGERADELLSVLELTGESERTLIIDYSSGMRKKIGLATALLHGPRLLVLDEPFEAVDPGLGGDRQADPHALRRRRRLCAALEPRHGAGRATLRHGRRHGAGRSGGGGPAGRGAREPDA
jgi:ABC-2 type transport system ATP-binding protein